MNAKELGAESIHLRGSREEYRTTADGGTCTVYIPQPGLTKRELFAAMAMQELVGNNEFSPGRTEAECAGDACRYADALLAELAKDQP